MAQRFTALEKLEEIERELAMRKRHYPAAIAKGSLSETTAARHCAVLKEIAEDYRQQLTEGSAAYRSVP